MYSVEQIVNSLYKVKNNKLKKRYIFDKSAIGGLNSMYLTILLFLSPFITYAAVFNKASFEYLGIAQAIILFIILLVVLMQVVLIIVYFNNRSLLKKVSDSWGVHFPGVELKMVLSSGATPYKEFTNHYEEALNSGLANVELHEFMKNSFSKMESENSDLIEAMRNDLNRK